jgi:Holliday junction resolvase-like predicted endonuclease
VWSGEIDIIALHDGFVAFVDIKTRTTNAFGAPELDMTHHKQCQMSKSGLGLCQASSNPPDAVPLWRRGRQRGH